jgi:regulator of replication initiation timing
MEAELTLLEARLADLIDAYKSLRMENSELAARVKTLQMDNQRSAEKLARAAAQIESILARLPEDE